MLDRPAFTTGSHDKVSIMLASNFNTDYLNIKSFISSLNFDLFIDLFI